MAYQPESATYDAGVLQLETTTPVQGGVGGAANSPLLSLANRTAYLKQHVDALEANQGNLATLNSPAFTGTPTAPAPALTDSSGKLATTSFVQALVGGFTYKNVAGGANVGLTAADCAAGVLVFQGALTANIQVVVPANVARSWVAVNATTGGYTLSVVGPGGQGVQIAQGYAEVVYCDTNNVFSGKSSFISPTMFGTPTAPTQSADDKTGKLATTGFVYNAVNGVSQINCAGNANVNVSAVQAGSGILVLTGALTGNIALLMPALTGRWIVANNTTGGFSVTIQYQAGGAGALLGAGGNTVYGDGTSFNVGVQKAAATGSVTYSLSTTALPGTIKANGALLSRTTYAALWAHAQASGNMAASDGAWASGQYSPGDGATTFRIPDLRGYHLRAFDDGRGVDSGRGIGSVQSDQLPSHIHGVNDPWHSHTNTLSDPGHGHGVNDPTHAHGVYGGSSGSYQSGGGYGASSGNNGANAGSTIAAGTGISVASSGSNISVGTNGSPTGISIAATGTGTETRVKNIAATACIYY